jgi:predicted nucleotidyltransferase
MTMIGSISAKITADGSGFTKAANKAQQDAKKTDSALASNLASFAKWAAGAAAAYMSVKKVADQFSILDNLAKTSDALGIQQERLQALQHVASLTGTQADQLSVNLERMQRNLGRVAREGGPAGKALEDIGISARNIINLPADKQLEAIAGAMGSVENNAIKASIAQDLFGRDGVRMLKMMEQLKADGLDPVVSELEQMGVALSRVDTAKIELANDALYKAQRAGDAIFQQLAVKVSPIIQGLSEAIVKLSKDHNRLAEIIDNTFNFAVKAVGTFANGIRGIQVIVKALEAGFQGFALAVNAIFAKVSGAIDFLINGAINKVNYLIEAVNKLPGVGLDAVDSFTSGATEFFERNAEHWAAALNGTMTELHNLAMQELPSEGIERWVAKVQAAAQVAAESIAAAAAGNIGGGGAMEGDTGLSEAEISAIEKRLEQLRLAGMSEIQIKTEIYAADQELLIDALENKMITQEQYDLLAQEAAQRHADTLTEIDRKAVEERLRLEELERQTKLRGIQTMFTNMAQLMNAGSRKLFEIGKASAIANAVVSAYEGISLTMSKYPYPLNVGMAAAHGAAAFAQVNAIKSQSFSAGAGAGMNFQGGQPSMPSGGQVAPQQPNRNISISLTGSAFGAGGIRGLIEEINNAVGDGMTLGVTG